MSCPLSIQALERESISWIKACQETEIVLSMVDEFKIGYHFYLPTNTCNSGQEVGDTVGDRIL
jgi:hypothetical protein